MGMKEPRDLRHRLGRMDALAPALSRVTTRKMQGDFLEGHIVIGQGEMA